MVMSGGACLPACQGQAQEIVSLPLLDPDTSLSPDTRSKSEFVQIVR